jgi:hypothetical protein
MKNILLIFGLFLMNLSYADTFRSLSNLEGITLSYTAEKPTKINLNLLLTNENEKFKELPLVLEVKIGEDILFDYLSVKGVFRGNIKSVFLSLGETLTATLKINSENTILVEDLKGNFSIKEGVMGFNSADDQSYTFIGGVWDDSDVPLFRIEQTDSTRKGIRFFVETNGNFEYNNLLLRIKIISPSHGVMIMEKELVITEEEYLDGLNKKMTLDLKGMNIEKEGNYYFEVKQNHIDHRVNGIETISYTLYDF